MRLLVVLCATVGSLLVVATANVGADASRLGSGKPFHFKSPTGNIQCRMDAENVACLLLKNSWPRLKPKPASCDVDWAPTDVSMYVSRTTSRWVVQVGGCRGDVGPLCYAADPCLVLAYGRSVQSVGARNQAVGIRCTSATNGITCRKLGTKPGARGFRIAREGYVIF